ncbi:MAG: DEAD/DEAH box helicase, partial [Candidatus Sumerlaeia bacterium]|nr:DEAD/DEAH box helicase [Candidatus Sumerlaeia bacterium]
MMDNTKITSEPVSDDVLTVLQRLRNHPRLSKNITYIHHMRAKPAEWIDFPEGLEKQLIEALNKKGILRLLSHQAEAIQKIRTGKNVIIATPTASGKTLCYNLPVLDAPVSYTHLRAHET